MSKLESEQISRSQWQLACHLPSEEGSLRQRTTIQIPGDAKQLYSSIQRPGRSGGMVPSPRRPGATLDEHPTDSTPTFYQTFNLDAA
ncbi:hypothetical protein MAPG_03911 [Magnaporthiopsis poae ATCC 64411]|uniref:Uncharacterized protein n=1 Tax=Magnaporthiopsis poae (strain ATCC 64411 / 73-15) TaxID=644358 RepID=A0A0C4DVA9_MAGP6|nr:hypothetical protein MAPG_03911 [Magnaporthiopsis poae ATCC 64411]